MSHFTRIQTRISDRILLEEALRQLAHEFETGEELRINGYNNDTAVGQVVVHTTGNYDIGLQLQDDQSYAICADWWGVQRTSNIKKDAFIQDLNRVYAHLTVKKQVLAQGLIIEEEKVLENGDIELVVSEQF